MSKNNVHVDDTNVRVKKYVSTRACNDTVQSVYTYEQKPVLRRPRSSALGSAALHSAARTMSVTQPTTPTKLHTAHLSKNNMREDTLIKSAWMKRTQPPAGEMDA